MKQNYNYCLTQLLKDEGGYTNNPNDKGGPTNFGITIADYKMYINANGTADDVKNMNIEDAKRIYKTKYWDKLGCDAMPSGIDYAVFDYGVNSGVARASKIYSKFSSETDSVKVINAICDERLIFMRSIRDGRDWTIFGRGWQRRVDGVRTNSLKLARPNTTTAPALGVAAVAGAGGVATAPHHFIPWIIAGTVVVILGVWIYTSVKDYQKFKLTLPTEDTAMKADGKAQYVNKVTDVSVIK